jgi:hypothetical protein
LGIPLVFISSTIVRRFTVSNNFGGLRATLGFFQNGADRLFAARARFMPGSCLTDTNLSVGYPQARIPRSIF